MENYLSKRDVSLDFFRGIMALWVAVGHLFIFNQQIIIPLSYTLTVDFFSGPERLCLMSFGQQAG